MMLEFLTPKMSVERPVQVLPRRPLTSFGFGHRIFEKSSGDAVSHFPRGAHRGAMRIAMEEATQPDLRRSERGWKLFMLLPRMLLHRPGRRGNVSKTKLTSRFDDFSAGHWDVLISASEAWTFRRRRHRRPEDDGERRVVRALMLVQ